LPTGLQPETTAPDSVEQTLALVALSALVFLLLVVLTFVLLRNLLKLYAERRLACSALASAPAW